MEEFDLKEDTRLMREALREAEIAASEDEVPVGAVITYKGRVIARGHNMTERLCDPTAHAEMIALTSACSAVGGKYLKDCTIYVSLEPCPMCAAALSWAQIGRVVWGADDPKKGFSLFNPPLLHPKTVSLKGILSEECSQIASEYFRNKRK